MLGKSVGGRGKKADSATVQVRVPVAIKDLVEQPITTFHKAAAGNAETTETPFTLCQITFDELAGFFEPTRSHPRLPPRIGT
jgi:hypothetical protein